MLGNPFILDPCSSESVKNNSQEISKMMDSNMIDFVVTWVDDSDPVWRKKKCVYTGATVTEGDIDARYRDWDMLKYWFRGVEKFAPWVRYVWFVTDDQKPEWLNLDHPKLKWVCHTDFIPHEYLPTFNSHTIEWNLHRIEGLADQFVYFNDDMFLIRNASMEDFFVKGLPCDRPGVESICPSEFFSYILFNNTFLLNRHFSLKDSIRKYYKKWFRYQTPKGFLRLLWYGRRKLIPGCSGQHIHIPFRKETFLTLWEQETEIIHNTCMHRLRSKEDVSPWCVRDWRCLEGNFQPMAPIGKAFSTDSIEHNGAIEYIRKQKGTIICLNDNESETDFHKHKQMLVDVFQELLPEKSSFEL